MNILLSVLPILLVLIGIVGLKKSARNVAFVAMIFTIILGFTAFNVTGTEVVLDVRKGVIGALQTCIIIFGAFSLLNVMKMSGAMDKINNTLLGITTDKRALLIIIAFCFGAFLEGAAGGGSPAAIVAPFLVGLGFNPMVAIVAALLSNGLSASFGGAGNPVISGIAPISDYISVEAASKASGLIHPISAIFFPTLLIFLLYGKNGLKNAKGFLFTIGITYGISYFSISNFIGPELVSLLTGAITMLVSYIYIKFIGMETPEEYKYKEISHGEKQDWENYTSLQAFLPYILLLIVLPVIRFSFPMSTLTRYGYGTWVGSVIFIISIIGMLILKKIDLFKDVLITSLKGVLPAFVTMVSLLVVANIMTTAGMMLTIAKGLSNTGVFYPFVAVLIGSLGTFMTGTAVGANMMFAPLHVQTAEMLNLNIPLLFGANNTGASLGNAICPNNVVAVATIVGENGKEGEIMKRIFKGWLILVVFAGILAMVYQNILPNIGV